MQATAGTLNLVWRFFSSTGTILNQIAILYQTWREGAEQQLYMCGISNVTPPHGDCLEGLDIKADLCNFC